MGGVGVVARDSNGYVVAGFNRRYWSGDVETLETSVILEGMRTSIENRWTSLEFESNSQVVINQIKGVFHTSD